MLIDTWSANALPTRWMSPVRGETASTWPARQPDLAGDRFLFGARPVVSLCRRLAGRPSGAAVLAGRVAGDGRLAAVLAGNPSARSGLNFQSLTAGLVVVTVIHHDHPLVQQTRQLAS